MPDYPHTILLVVESITVDMYLARLLLTEQRGLELYLSHASKLAPTHLPRTPPPSKTKTQISKRAVPRYILQMQYLSYSLECHASGMHNTLPYLT